MLHSGRLTSTPRLSETFCGQISTVKAAREPFNCVGSPASVGIPVSFLLAGDKAWTVTIKSSSSGDSSCNKTRENFETRSTFVPVTCISRLPTRTDPNNVAEMPSSSVY